MGEQGGRSRRVGGWFYNQLRYICESSHSMIVPARDLIVLVLRIMGNSAPRS